MRPKLSASDIAIITNAAQNLIGDMKVESVHLNTPRVCDHCRNADKEAFPYHVYDTRGRFWRDLCNGCFDELGCAYEVAE